MTLIALLPAASATSAVVTTGRMQVAARTWGSICVRLHCENWSLPFSCGAIRNVRGVVSQGLAGSPGSAVSPSCGAPKLWPISCAVTSEVSVETPWLIDAPNRVRQSEPMNAMPTVEPSRSRPVTRCVKPVLRSVGCESR